MRTAIAYNFLIESTMMASIAILLMIPIRLLARKKLGNRVICFAWLLVALRLLVPLSLPNPIIHQIRSPFAPDEAIRPIAGQVQVRFYDAVSQIYDGMVYGAGIENAVTDAVQDLRISSQNGMLSIRLMQVYLLGAAAVLAWFVISNLRFQHRLRADRIEPISGKMLQEYQQLCRERGVKPIPVYFVDPLPSACLVGGVRPYIALPLTARPQEVRQVLMHEICHYQGKDHWWGLIRLACCAVHWFNPLVWMAASMSRTDCELRCDDRVIAPLAQQQRVDYANVLVLAAQKRDQPGVTVLATGMSMTGRRLKNRVLGIVNKAVSSKWLAIGFAMLSSLALACAFATSERPLLPSIPKAVSTVARLESPLTQTDEAVSYAKHIWQEMNVEVNGLEWSAVKRDGHYEAVAYQDGEGVLNMAFLPEGRLIYLCNILSGDREAFSADDAWYDDNPEAQRAILNYALNVLETIAPGVTEEDWQYRSESKAGESRFLHFSVENSKGDIPAGIRVQVNPEVTLSYYIDHRFFGSEDADRLEPGNG